MKVKKVNNNTGKWFYLKNSILVKTPIGDKKVDKFYFNGFYPTYELNFKNLNTESIYSIKATGNHRFRSIDGNFVAVENLTYGCEFDNGWIFSSKKLIEEMTPTMDMEVPDAHCYFLDNGIVSHNTSLIMGGVSEGINPDPAMVYTQTTASGEMFRINPNLLLIMKDRNVYNKETISDLNKNMGSVQYVDWLDSHEKQVFKTAYEIDQNVIIRLGAQRAKYIDQGQSLNMFVSSEELEERISGVHKKAFLDENIKSLYYIYSESGVKIVDECVVCEG